MYQGGSSKYAFSEGTKLGATITWTAVTAGTYLKNQTANIDATVSDGYTWQGWSVISGNTPD